MKLSLTLIEILVISSVVVPFFIFIYIGLKSTSRIKQKAEKIIKPNGFLYKQKEVWNNKFIGLAEENNTLTYIKFDNNSPHVFNLKLSEIKSCALIKSYKIGKDKVSRLDYLELKLEFHSYKKNALSLSFFNTEEGFSEDYELRRIENWDNIINSKINVSLKKAS